MAKGIEQMREYETIYVLNPEMSDGTAVRVIISPYRNHFLFLNNLR